MNIECERRGRLRVPRPLWWAAVGLLGVMLATMAGAREAQAATRTVPTSPGCATIQGCVDASNPGDTIRIRTGRYDENVVVDKELTIAGSSCSSPRRVIVDASPGGVDGVGFELTDDADGTDIRCLFVRHGTDGIRAGARDPNTGDPIEFVDDVGLLSIVVEGSDDDNVNITGDDLRVDRSQFFSAGDKALDVAGNGAWVSRILARGTNQACVEINGDDARVETSRFERCEDDDGVQIFGDAPVVSSNTVLFTNNGIETDGAAPRVIGNTVRGSAEIDVDCEADCENGLIERNTSTGNPDDNEGFRIRTSDGATGLTIRGNTAADNSSDGFDLDIDDSFVIGNTALRNGSEDESGFDIRGGGNLFEDNRSNENNLDGFRLSFDFDDGSDGNVFRDNLARDNSKDGFDIDADPANDPAPILDTLLEDNTALDNQAEGIENNATDTDVIDNLSRGNRTDCANDGTIDENEGNNCADGSDFDEPPEVD